MPYLYFVFEFRGNQFNRIWLKYYKNKLCYVSCNAQCESVNLSDSLQLIPSKKHKR